MRIGVIAPCARQQSLNDAREPGGSDQRRFLQGAGGIERPLTIERGQGHVGLRKSKRQVAALDANAGASSHLTHRWREMDSNPRSRFTYSPFRTPSCRPRDGPVRPNGNHAFATGYQAFDACVRRRVSGARAITAMVLRSRLQNPVEGRLRRAPDASTAVCEIVELTSAATRAEAHAFYRSIGYEPNSLRFRKVLVA